MEELRTLLARALCWADAHVSAEDLLQGYPAELQGAVLPGQERSAYQLLEHLRIAQQDILDFSRNPNYKARNWPTDYWPGNPAPPSSDAWKQSVHSYLFDREEMVLLIQDESRDLFEPFAHGDGQTLARQAVLLIDHNAYHLGQIALFRKIQNQYPAGKK